MRLQIRTIRDVAERQMCCGCGVCAYISPDEIRMVDTLQPGRRPLVTDRGDSRSAEAMAACPGIQLAHDFDRKDPRYIRELVAGWGPVLEIWEGFASDPEIRFAGSSGGAATALSLYCMEQQGMHGTLHIAARKDVPYLNETVLSKTRAEMLARTGSRYAPASPCDGLQMVEDAPEPCVFIGKPCDVAATSKARKLRRTLDAKLGLTIAVFCAGTPSTRGTLEMIKAMGVDDPSTVTSVRYRGNGWPGKATAMTRGASGQHEIHQLTYEQSWGEILTKHVQWRCRVCPDHTGEFADIAVGDPWHKPPTGNEPGRSLIVVRSPRGQEILSRAIAARYIHAKRVGPEVLWQSQPNLLRARASVWGRLLALRIAGAAVPHFYRLPMARHWLRRLTLQAKVSSVVGTFRRIRKRRLRHRCSPKIFKPTTAPATHKISLVPSRNSDR